MTYGRIPGCDYCPQCNSGYTWLKITEEHRERLFCDCGWAARLRQADDAQLTALWERGDQIAAGEIKRRAMPGRAA